MGGACLHIRVYTSACVCVNCARMCARQWACLKGYRSARGQDCEEVREWSWPLRRTSRTDSLLCNSAPRLAWVHASKEVLPREYQTLQLHLPTLSCPLWDDDADNGLFPHCLKTVSSAIPGSQVRVSLQNRSMLQREVSLRAQWCSV